MLLSHLKARVDQGRETISSLLAPCVVSVSKTCSNLINQSFPKIVDLCRLMSQFAVVQSQRGHRHGWGVLHMGVGPDSIRDVYHYILTLDDAALRIKFLHFLTFFEGVVRRNVLCWDY
jgi:hypothetical protein